MNPHQQTVHDTQSGENSVTEADAQDLVQRGIDNFWKILAYTWLMETDYRNSRDCRKNPEDVLERKCFRGLLNWSLIVFALIFVSIFYIWYKIHTDRELTGEPLSFLEQALFALVACCTTAISTWIYKMRDDFTITEGELRVANSWQERKDAVKDNIDVKEILRLFFLKCPPEHTVDIFEWKGKTAPRASNLVFACFTEYVTKHVAVPYVKSMLTPSRECPTNDTYTREKARFMFCVSLNSGSLFFSTHRDAERPDVLQDIIYCKARKIVLDSAD